MMWYWGKSNFEGLKAIAAHYSSEANYRLFGEYCALQESGLRKQAFTSLAAFIAEAHNWSAPGRNEFVDGLMKVHLENPNVHNLITYPLLNDLMIPVLRQWIEDHPQDATPHRWLGILRKDPAELEHALKLDPEDQIALHHRVLWYLEGAYYDCHHLSEGIFLGDPEVCLQNLYSAHALSGQIHDESARESLQSQCEYYKTLVTDWRTYSSLQPEETFPEWCASKGREYAWCKAYYYEK